jgi:dipeptidyl aminopeptidase/acylaminoacyl peptidase
MSTGAELAEFNRGNDFYGKLFFTADGGLLTTADSGRMVLRASLDAAPLFRAGTRARSTQHMVMSPDGQWIAVNGWGDTVFLWSVAKQRSGRAVPVPGIGSGVIAFSPDGNTIATSGGANGLYLWDVRSGAPIKSFHNLPGSLSHAWFSPDGKSIVTFSMFDDRFRIVYIDPRARPAAENVVDDSSTARLPFGPPSNSPKTVGGVVTGPNKRAVADAVVEILNGDAPDSVVARTTTSYGGYFSFTGIRFRHALIRVHKPGFETGVRYIHVSLWGDEGASGIELTPVQGAGGVRGH